MVNIKLTRRARDYLMRRMSKKKDDEEGGFVEESPRGAAMRTSMSGKVAPEGMYMPPPPFFFPSRMQSTPSYIFF
jgi:hypothetical protein